MNIMNIKIKYRDDTCPRLKYIGGNKSNWIDLYSYDDVTLKKGEFKLIDLGVAMKLPEGYEAYICPRSSTYKNFKVIQTNHIGIVDESYCGPNDWWKYPVLAMEDTVIHKGDRICQFRIQEHQPNFEFVEDDLSGEVDRNGFGSTGK